MLYFVCLYVILVYAQFFKCRVKQTVKPLSKVEVLAATPKDTPLNEVLFLIYV